MNNIIKAISVIIGTIIGAGFASGKEIYIFFAQYGKVGIMGAIISSMLIAITIYSTIYITNKLKITNNNEFIKNITANEKMQNVLKNIINIFLLILYWIMSTGFCTFFKQEFNISIIFSAILNAIIIYNVINKNIEGIEKLNAIVVPIMVIIIVIVGVTAGVKKYTGVSDTNNLSIVKNTNISGEKLSNIYSAIFSSILYASYNSITLIPITVLLGKKIKNKKHIKIVTMISAIIFGILIIMIYQILVTSQINIKETEIPILKILERNSKVEKISFSIAIITAIFTSEISAVLGVTENIKNSQKSKKITLIICILGIPIAYIGFGMLVEIIYPVFGIIGILQMILILKKLIVLQKKAKTDIKYIEKISR